jgi:hypothetical protein
MLPKLFSIVTGKSARNQTLKIFQQKEKIYKLGKKKNNVLLEFRLY